MERLDIEEGWIRKGWFRHEGKLLIHLRDRQDGRQLLGDRIRVLQDWGKIIDSQSGDTGQVNTYQEDIFKKSFVVVIKGVSTITSRRLNSLEIFFCITKPVSQSLRNPIDLLTESRGGLDIQR